MKTKEVDITVDTDEGEKVGKVVVTQYPASKYLELQRFLLEGRKVNPRNKDTLTEVDGEKMIEYTQKLLEFGVKSIPFGYDLNTLLDKINQQDLTKIINAIEELNSAGDVEKK